MKHLLVFVAACALTAACKDAPDRPASKNARANEVWPEAPRPTSTTGTCRFRYQPANMTGYRITASGGAPKGAPVSLDFRLAVDLRLGAGATPSERDASLRRLDLDVSGAATTKLHLDDSDAPFATLVFDDDRRMTVRAVDSHPLAAFGVGELLDSALVLFPELPTDAITAGQHWIVTRSMPVGASGTRIDVTYRLTYAGDSACPSGRSRCALIELAASSSGAIVDSATVVYGFAGKLFLDLERGILDESHVRVDLNVARGPAALAIHASYVIQPI